MNSSRQILLVDDDPNILESLGRQLRNKFKLEKALGAIEGLKTLASKGPFAIVVSDMRMPQIDGVQFLGQVQKQSPSTVRIMLTGNADQGTAARAVNEGNIFRFLTKPCDSADLISAISAGINQYDLIVAEKELLQNTLSGSIKVVTDILSMVDPAAFGWSMSLREPARKLAQEFGIEDSWEIELGAMLSQIGRVTLPESVLTKLNSGTVLTKEEDAEVRRVPEVGKRLLINIPRLEHVAEIVFLQNKHFDGSGYPLDSIEGEKIPLGARLLKALRDFVEEERKQGSKVAAYRELLSRPGWYDPRVLDMLRRVMEVDDTGPALTYEESVRVTAAQLMVGHKVLADVETVKGLMLLPAGHLITEAVFERLQSHARLVGIKEPILVKKP